MTEPIKVPMRIFEVPIGVLPPVPPTGNYELLPHREVGVKRMTIRQQQGLLQLIRGLQDAGATLEDGSLISCQGHAVRWMLEQIATPSENRTAP